MFRLNLFLLLVVVLAALSVVTTQHLRRKLVIEFEGERDQAKALAIEWGRLQLEQATWAAHARVEMVAAKQLGMLLPDNKRKRIILPQGVIMPAAGNKP